MSRAKITENGAERTENGVILALFFCTWFCLDKDINCLMFDAERTENGVILAHGSVWIKKLFDVWSRKDRKQSYNCVLFCTWFCLDEDIV